MIKATSGATAAPDISQLLQSSTRRIVQNQQKADGHHAHQPPQEGTLVLLGTACAPHPPCIMTVRQTRHERRCARGFPSKVQACAPDQHDTSTHTKSSRRMRQRGRKHLPARAKASRSSRRWSSASWSSARSMASIGFRVQVRGPFSCQTHLVETSAARCQ